MNFLENIFEQLHVANDTPLLQRNGSRGTVEATGRKLSDLIGRARAFLASKGLKKGDRCVLLAPNSIRWVAMDLAIMAEGLIAVPLYARQAPAELVAMMKDCSPSLICCGTSDLRDSYHRELAGRSGTRICWRRFSQAIKALLPSRCSHPPIRLPSSTRPAHQERRRESFSPQAMSSTWWAALRGASTS